MNTQHGAFARAALLFAVCITAAACPGSDGATGPRNPGGDSLQNPTEDRIAPTVRSTRPAPEASGVAVDAVIEVEFSEPMDTASINGNAIKIDGVPGVVTLTGRTAQFRPTGALRNAIRHTARVTTRARDTAGNPMTQEYSWSFTTVSPPLSVVALPLSDGKFWRYDVADTNTVIASGITRVGFRGDALVRVEGQVTWQGRSAWETRVYRFPAVNTNDAFSVRTEYLSQGANGLKRWKGNEWRTVFPPSGATIQNGVFLLQDGPTHTKTPAVMTVEPSTAVVPAGTYSTLRVRHEFTETGQYAPKDIFETRTEHYTPGVGLVLANWSYSNESNDPQGVSQYSSGRMALAVGSFPQFGVEQEPNDGFSTPTPMWTSWNLFSGTTLVSHGGTVLTDASVGCSQECIHPNVSGERKIQDWYRLVLTSSDVVRIMLAFDHTSSGAPRPNDLDLYLFRQTGATLQFVASSANEPGKGERLLRSLAAGTYIIAVQAWDTPGPEPVRYWVYQNLDK